MQVNAILEQLKDGAAFDREVKKVGPSMEKRNTLNAEGLASLVSRHLDRLKNMKVGTKLVVCGGWLQRNGGHAVIHVVERTSENEYAFVTCNTGEGVDYHPQLSATYYPKEKRKCSIRVPSISARRFLEPAVWYVFFRNQVVADDDNGLEILYEVVLPHFAGGLLHKAVESNMDKCGHWETIQRAGTCYFRSILCTMRYLLKADGFARDQQKLLYYIIRRGFLDRVESDLDALIDVSCSATSSDSETLTSQAFESADERLVRLANTQCGLAAVKLWRKGVLLKNDLEDLEAQIKRVENKTGRLSEAQAADEPMTKTASDDFEIGSSALLTPFPGFDLLDESRSIEIFAGGATEAVPQMFVDLRNSEDQSSSSDIRDIFDVFGKCKDQLDRLRAKTSIAAASVSMHQICCTVEFLCTSSSFSSSWHAWTFKEGSMTSDDRRKGLSSIFSVAVHYVAACMSLPADRALAARRAMTMASLLAVFDSILRVDLDKNDLKKDPVTDILKRGRATSVEGVSVGSAEPSGPDLPDAQRRKDAVRSSSVSSDGFGIVLSSFDGKTLNELTSSMLLTSPELTELRYRVLTYWNKHSCVGAPAIFGFDLKPPGFIEKADSPTHQFVEQLRLRLGVDKKSMPDGGARSPYLSYQQKDAMSSLEQSLHWFVSNFEGKAPEFTQLRDMVALYRLLLTPPQLLKAANKTLPDLWFITHATPGWGVEYCDPDGKFATMSLTFAGHKTGKQMFVRGATLNLQPKGMRGLSPANAERYVKPSNAQIGTTEEDVLQVADDELPSFDSTVSPEDAERLVSYLSTPGLSIPLVLSYFSSESRLGQLLHPKLQELLESVLYEPGHFVGDEQLLSQVPNVIGKKRLGTPFGRLMNEALRSPKSLFEPLMSMCEIAANLCGNGGIHSPFARLFLFVLRIAIRVERFCVRASRLVNSARTNSLFSAYQSYRSAHESVKETRVCLRRFLGFRASRMLRVWLKRAHADEAIGDALEVHTHLALLNAYNDGPAFATMVGPFMCSTAFVVLWHSKPEMNVKDAPKESESEDPMAELRKAMKPPTGSEAANAIMSSMPSFDVPVHDVFAAIQIRRNDVLSWAKRISERELDHQLQQIVNVALQEATLPVTLGSSVPSKTAPATKTSDERSKDDSTSTSFFGWQQVSTKPLLCKRVIETEHNYPPSRDQYWTVDFPGAELVTVYFDNQTSTEKDCDFVTFYRDETYTSHWGSQKRFSGGAGAEWPGANGRPPLTIPASRFIVHFHSDATTQDWGFRLTACAPVTVANVNELRAALKRDDESVFSHATLQRALADHNNSVEHAKSWLTTHKERVLQEQNSAGKEASNLVHGLYNNPIGSLQLNLQTAEVYMRKRMLMPVPTDIASEPQFKELFDHSASTPYCAFKANDANRRWIEILTSNKDHQGQIYSIMAWTPLRPANARGPAIARRGAALPKANERTLGAFNLPHIPPQSTESNVVHWNGSKFEHYAVKFSKERVQNRFRVVLSGPSDNEHEDRFSKLFLEILRRHVHLLRNGMSDILVFQEKSNASPRKRFLMFVPPQGDVEEVRGHPGAWFEIRESPLSSDHLDCFALVDCGRRMQRKLVYSTRSSRALRTFPPMVNEITDLPPVWLRDAGGNLFGGHVDTNGKMVPKAGSGSLSKMKIGSLTICRTRGTARKPLIPIMYSLTENETEELVPRDALTGLIPDVLLDTYRFWRTGTSTIRAYPKRKDVSATDDALLVIWTTKGATVLRRKEGKTMTLHCVSAQIKHQDEKCKMSNLTKILCRLENASHILVWSDTAGTFGEECGVSIVELPRLRARFRCTYEKSRAMARLESLDYDGLFVTTTYDNDLRRISRGIPHFLVLQNALGDRFLMVPNYGVSRPKVRSCPFSTMLVMDRSNTWSDNVKTRYYVYPLHVSGAFVTTPSLSSSLYLVLLRLLAREYILVSRLLTSCHTDQPLSKEERYILSLIAESYDDAHPNAHACRLQLTILCLESGETTVPWAEGVEAKNAGKEEDCVQKDLESYLNKYSHVSIECRLSEHGETILMNRYFLRKFVDRNGRLDTARLRSMPPWLQGRLAYLDLLKKRRVLDESEKPDTPVNMIAHAAVEKLGGGLYYGFRQNAVTKVVTQLKKLGLKYLFHYKRPHEREKSVSGAAAVSQLEMLRSEGSSREPMMMGRTNRTGFLLLYEMVMGTVSVDVTAHPLGLERMNAPDARIADDAQKVEDDTVGASSSEGMLSRWKEKAEQLQPMMPSFEIEELTMLLNKYQGNVEELVEIYLTQGEIVLREMLKTLQAGHESNTTITNAEPKKMYDSPYVKDAKNLHETYPQYTLEECIALLETQSGDVTAVGNMMASHPVFSLRGIARQRIKQNNQIRQALGDIEESEGPRPTTSSSWCAAKLMSRIMFLKATKNGKGKLSEPDLLMFPILDTFLVAAENGWVQRQQFPQFPYKQNADALMGSEGMPSASSPSIDAFLKLVLDASTGIVTSAPWKVLEQPLAPPQRVKGSLTLARGYDSGHFRGLSDCSCSFRRLKLTSETSTDRASFVSQPLAVLSLSEHVQVEPIRPSLRRQQSRQNVENLLTKLPFDISKHASCQSTAARRVLQRLESDLAYAATFDQTRAPPPQLKYLNHVHAAKLIESNTSASNLSEISRLLQHALIRIETLLSMMKTLQHEDRIRLKADIKLAMTKIARAQDPSTATNKTRRTQGVTNVDSNDTKALDSTSSEDSATKDDDTKEESDVTKTPDGCDEDMFEQLPSDVRRTFTLILKSAVGDEDSSKIERTTTATTVLQRDDMTKYLGGSSAFTLLRSAGQKMTISWEILVGSILSSQQTADLLRLNPFLTPNEIESISDHVSEALLRTVRIAQTNRAILLATRLTTLIGAFLNRLVVLSVPEASNEMANVASAQYPGNVSATIEAVKRMVKDRDELRAQLGQEQADVVFALHDFDLDAATREIRDDDARAMALAKFARRRGFVNGVKLLHTSSNQEEADHKDAVPPPRELLRTKSSIMREKKGMDESALRALAHMLKYAADALAQELSCQREYMSEAFWSRLTSVRTTEMERAAESKRDTTSIVARRFDKLSPSFDPRFLVFEYSSGFVLRRRQCELIMDFVAAAQDGQRSCVHQMIMGAGKTRVIGPMLALILADGKSLVTQVCPTALLEMTRGVMRKTFSRVLRKRIYTLKFDRQCEAAESPSAALRLHEKLALAAKERAIVCTTPESIKSLMLKYIDLLQTIEGAHASVRLPASSVSEAVRKKILPDASKLAAHSLVADALNRTLALWSRKSGGVALIDEVDLVLHPLRSELNFPIGPKKALGLSPRRWEMPLFLLDGVLGSRAESTSGRHVDEDALVIRQTIVKEIETGVKCCAIRRLGDQLILLQTDFYESNLKLPCAKWVLKWLSHQDEIRQGLRTSISTMRQDIADATVDLESLARQHLLSYVSHTPMACSVKQKQNTNELIRNCYSEDAVKLINLTRQWIETYLPHVLSKVDRVSYGLLHLRDLERWRKETNLAENGGNGADDAKDEPPSSSGAASQGSRWWLAVPYIGKDVPSRAAEFACPEVLIGLSVLAFRYEGLRMKDFRLLVSNLKDRMRHETGPVPDRPSRILFDSWISSGLRRIVDDDAKSATEEVLPLELLQVDDPPRFRAAFRRLAKLPSVVVHFLDKIVFPRVLRRSEMKLSASGVDLGGDTLFGTRLGFSGTPSDLLPPSLAPCNYEKGSEAKMIRVLSTPEYVRTTCYAAGGIEVKELLRRIATHEDNFAALIDTGALITGMSNEDVARYLLRVGLRSKEACVFMDATDRKMVVTRSDGPPLSLESSGIRKEKRFTFYDQVHTTGIDIRQPLDAVAAVTIGKDMTLRDYSQGCWRMRGIGRGQTVHVFLIREVVNLVKRVSSTSSIRNDLLAWLLTNSLRSEELEQAQLQRQMLSTIWRRAAFRDLRASRAPTEQLPYRKNPKRAMLCTRFHEALSDDDVAQVINDLPPTYTAEGNETSDTSSSKLIEKNRKELSVFFIVLRTMNQRMPQVAQIFNSLAPTYIKMADQGMDVKTAMEHMKQSPLAQVIPAHYMDKMFNVAMDVTQKELAKHDKMMEARKEAERRRKEKTAKERATRLLSKIDDVDSSNTAPVIADGKDKVDKSKTTARWQWINNQQEWNDYVEEDNEALERAFIDDEETHKLNNRWGEYIVYLRYQERRQKKVSSGFERKVRRLAPPHEQRAVNTLFRQRVEFLRQKVKDSSMKDAERVLLTQEMKFIDQLLTILTTNADTVSDDDIFDATKTIGKEGASKTDDEERPTTTTTTTTKQTKTRLVRSIRLFREQLEQGISGEIVARKSYRAILRSLAEQHRSALSPTEWESVERILKRVEDEHVEHEFNDMEIVQEQEKEVFETKRKRTQKQWKGGALSSQRKTWDVNALFTTKGRVGLLKNGTFYPARHFRIGNKDLQSLPYPYELLISEHHSAFLNATSEPRRMKNVTVLMRWRSTSVAATALGGATESSKDEKRSEDERANEELVGQLSPMMPGFDDEELGTLLRHFDGDVQSVMEEYLSGGEESMRDILRDMSNGTKMSTREDTDGGAARKEKKTRREETKEDVKRALDACSYFCVIVSLSEAETIRRARQIAVARLCDAADESNESGEDAIERWKHVELYTLDGLSLTSVLDATSPPAPLPLTRQTTEQILHAVDEKKPFVLSTVCAKFFNSTLWYTNDELIRLLRVFSDAPESQRRKYFECLQDCRRRDSKNWITCSIAQLFEHSDERQLLRVREIVIRVRRAVMRRDISLKELFQRVDSDGDGFITSAELASALTTLAIIPEMSARDANALMKHADRNDDGNMSINEFVSQFSVEESARYVRSDVTSSTVEMSEEHFVAKNSLQQRLKKIEERWKRKREEQSVSENQSTFPLKTNTHTSLSSVESIGRLFLCSGSAFFGNDSVMSAEKGEYPSVAARGVNVGVGRWYYEVVVLSSGRASVGWADTRFSPRSNASRGVGDDKHSWGFDGFSCVARHDKRDRTWGFHWSAGDVIGCLADVQSLKRDDVEQAHKTAPKYRVRLSYSLNGEWGLPMGDAFEFTLIGEDGLVPVASFEASFQGRLNFGKVSFQHDVPRGARSVYEHIQMSLIEQVVSSVGSMYGKLQATTGDSGIKIDGLHIDVDGAGFPSCVLAGVLLTKGKWYFETLIQHPGVAVQIGWGDIEFVGTSRGGHGIGDDKHSWAFDGARVNRWHVEPRLWGRRWQAGDTLGVAADVDNGILKFSLNGSFVEPFGTAFENIDFVGGLTPGFTANAPFKCVVNFGHTPLTYSPPPGYRPVSVWIDKHRPSEQITSMTAPLLARALSTGTSIRPSFAELDCVAMNPSSGRYQIAVDSDNEWSMPPAIERVDTKTHVISAHKSSYTCTVLSAVYEERSRRMCVFIRAQGSGRDGPLQSPLKSRLNGDRCVESLLRTSTRRSAYVEGVLVFHVDDAEKKLVFQFGEDGYSDVVVTADRGDVDKYLMKSTRACVVRPTGLGLTTYPSATASQILLTRGRWYFEATILDLPEDTGDICVGWGDSSFFGDWSHGSGVGDDAHSWGIHCDKKRELSPRGWTNTTSSGGAAVNVDVGDIIGCAVDVEAGHVAFSVNGKWLFRGENVCTTNGVRPAVSVGAAKPPKRGRTAARVARQNRIGFNFGESKLRYPPVTGHLAVHEWLLWQQARLSALSARQHARRPSIVDRSDALKAVLTSYFSKDKNRDKVGIVCKGLGLSTDDRGDSLHEMVASIAKELTEGGGLR